MSLRAEVWVAANLGVNPSLTITAQAERAFSLWPNAGEADTRPEPASAYRRVDAVAPRSPFVPAGAPRLPVVAVGHGAGARVPVLSA